MYGSVREGRGERAHLGHNAKLLEGNGKTPVNFTGLWIGAQMKRRDCKRGRRISLLHVEESSKERKLSSAEIRESLGKDLESNFE